MERIQERDSEARPLGFIYVHAVHESEDPENQTNSSNVWNTMFNCVISLPSFKLIVKSVLPFLKVFLAHPSLVSKPPGQY